MPTERELPTEWPTLSRDRRVAWTAIALAFPIATHQLTSTSFGVRERDIMALIGRDSATSFTQAHYSVFQPNPRRARRDRYRALADESLRRRISKDSEYDARVGAVVAEEVARDRVRFGEWQG